MSGCLHTVLQFLDGFLCLFVFYPLCIFHWRGTWGLQDYYFFPDKPELSFWFSVVIGTVGCLILTASQVSLFRSFPPSSGVNVAHASYVIVSRSFMYISAWMLMCYQRGIWNLLDFYLTTGWKNSFMFAFLAYILMCFTRSTRCITGLPFYSSPDTDHNLLTEESIYGVQPSQPIQYFAAMIYFRFVVVVASTVIWRGVWNIIAEFLPSDATLGDLYCLAFGYGTCTVLMLIKLPLAKISAKLDEYSSCKILYEDLVYLVAMVCHLVLWRGSWNLCLTFTFPQPGTGDWITHWIGTVALMLLQAFNTVSIEGADMDGSYCEGRGIFPNDFITYYLKDRFHREPNGEQCAYVLTYAGENLSDYEDEGLGKYSTLSETRKIEPKLNADYGTLTTSSCHDISL